MIDLDEETLRELGLTRKMLRGMALATILGGAMWGGIILILLKLFKINP
jgi:hypothetical protein